MDSKLSLRDAMATADVDEMIHDIAKGTALGATDGSFKGEFGAASWVIENAKGSQRITGNILISGHPMDHIVHRRESEIFMV